MTIMEIEAKSILRKHKKIDSWYISRYGMNLYRGCLHGCAYCDGRAEKYNAPDNFAEEIEVKMNAPQILRRELDPQRRRKPLKPGFIMLGGGVGDSYQAVEKKYRLSRQALEIVNDFGFPVHMLTKSSYVEQDLNMFQQINEKNRAVLSMSFSSVDEKVSRILEPGVPPPEKRLDTLARFKEAGIPAGMFLMPVIPFITDTSEMLEAALQKAVEYELDFVIFSGMTLKEGHQQDYFYQELKAHYSGLISEYQKIYRGDKWGGASPAYYESLHKRFNQIAKNYSIPLRIPPHIFKGLIDENDAAIVILEHMDYLLKLEGKTSPFGYAAYSISKLDESLSEFQGDLKSLKGIGPKTEQVLKEIIETGTASWYEKLLYRKDV